MITIRELIIEYSEVLAQHDIPNHVNEVEILLSHFLNATKSDLFLYENKVNSSVIEAFKRGISERITRKPLQYIIGNVPFLNTTIKVNENVLIPRPETEFMVDLILKECGIVHSSLNSEFKILDLCTGSGAIAIALKENIKFATVVATDVSDMALKVAKANAKLNDVEINFIQSDLFETFYSHHPKVTETDHEYEDQISYNSDSDLLIGDKSQIEFDLIISNPPYISLADYNALQPELFHEPKLAFVSENDGYYFYEKIISEAIFFMKPNAKLYLEIGENQAKKIISLAKNNVFLKIDVFKDLCEKDRIVRLMK